MLPICLVPCAVPDWYSLHHEEKNSIAVCAWSIFLYPNGPGVQNQINRLQFQLVKSLTLSSIVLNVSKIDRLTKLKKIEHFCLLVYY